MPGVDFTAAITKVATKGHGEDAEVEVTLTFPHNGPDASAALAKLAEVKRHGQTCEVSIATMWAQESLFKLIEQSAADMGIDGDEGDGEGESGNAGYGPVAEELRTTIRRSRRNGNHAEPVEDVAEPEQEPVEA